MVAQVSLLRPGFLFAMGPAETPRSPKEQVRVVVGAAGRERWNPTSREKRARCPKFPVRSSGKNRVKFREPTTLHRKLGGVGHPAIVEGLEPKSGEFAQKRDVGHPLNICPRHKGHQHSGQ